MAAMAVNRFGGGAARQYEGDEFGSSIFADPSLQYPKDRFVDGITAKVEEVVGIKKDNFDYSKDKNLGWLMLAATVALVVLGIVAIVTTQGTVFAASAAGVGVGVGAFAIGTYTLGISLYSFSKGRNKERNMDSVQTVFRDASRQRIGRTILENQKIEELEMVGINNRVGVRGLNRFENRRPYLAY